MKKCGVSKQINFINVFTVCKNIAKPALILLCLVCVYAVPIAAEKTKITSVSIVPSNPGYGDMAVVYVNLCVMQYGSPTLVMAVSSYNTPQTVGAGGQVFVVDANGVDRKDVTLSGKMSLDISYTTGGTTGGCTDCGGSGIPLSVSYTVHIPDLEYFSLCNPSALYLIVGIMDYGMYTIDWMSMESSSSCGGSYGNYYVVPLPINVPTPTFTINKRYEGMLQQTGDLVVYSVDYSYGGAGAFTITDPIPGGGDFTLVSYGPTASGAVTVSAPATGNTSGTLTWTFPSRASAYGMQTGTVWMLLRYNKAATPSGAYTNTATGTQGATVKTSSATITAGVPAISILKDQSVGSLMTGDTITYTLSYDVNGYALKNYQPFDNITTGTYNCSGAPAGWKLGSSASPCGTWTIMDPCTTGGNYLNSTSIPSTNPSLLLDDGSSTNTSDQFCTGMIVSDLYIEDSAYGGADSQIIIRSNGQTSNNLRSVGVIASIDTNPGYLAVQVCSGNTCACPATTITNSAGAVEAKKWYRVRILVEDGTACSTQRIRAKIWAVGDPEPGPWDLDYIMDVSDASWQCGTACTGATNTDWRPGVLAMAGGGTTGVQDSYDNFMVYSARSTMASAVVYDSVPANVTYAGCNGCSSTSPVTWNSIANVSMSSGSFTWWGKVSGCQPISNQALIGGTGMASIASNWVEAEVNCWSPTSTATPTFTVTLTVNPSSPTFTVTRTSTPTYTPTKTLTASPTQTGTPTYTFTVTNTLTYTMTPTNTYTRTNTSTYTPTNTYSNTATKTPTNSPSPTPSNTQSPTPSFTMSVTPSSTSTRTFTPTVTQSNTPTGTYTVTNTPTSSQSPTYTFTSTPTYTSTPTRTLTATLTITDTISSNTPTDTPTFTCTPTGTPTFTGTSTFTYTPTSTSTSSPTGTYTLTATPTSTSTITDTWTVTIYTATITETFTPTGTPTSTQTITQTDTPTATETITGTWTPVIYSPTITETGTPTATGTGTPSLTVTRTPTYTNTATPTYTFTFTPTVTGTNTPTATLTGTPTLTPTATYTYTATPTFTVTCTITMTGTPMSPKVMLTAGMSASGDNPEDGSIITYRIEITNNDINSAYGLNIWDTIPAGTEYAGCNSSVIPVLTGGVITWNFPEDMKIEPGKVYVIEFQVKILDTQLAGNIENSASADYYDPFYTTVTGRHPPVTTGITEFPRQPVVAFPNPFIGKTASSGTLKFANVPPNSLIVIYTLSGEFVVNLRQPTVKYEWDMKNADNAPVSPGVYYYIVRNMHSRQTQMGKLFIMK